MAFDPKSALTSQSIYSGWHLSENMKTKVTGDYESAQAAGLAIQSYATNLGLAARDTDFYVVKEITTFVPLTKTRFTITTTTDVIV